jgi:hypothetical protein
MARLIISFLAFGMLTACLVGCHASADVAPNHASQAAVPQ